MCGFYNHLIRSCCAWMAKVSILGTVSCFIAATFFTLPRNNQPGAQSEKCHRILFQSFFQSVYHKAEEEFGL